MSHSATPLVEADHVDARYGPHTVLSDVSVAVPRGSVVGVIGPNGSGKTTLLRLMAGARRPERGQVLLDGRDVTSIPVRRLAQRLALVVQEPATDLLLSVADVVLMGRTPHLGSLRRPGASDEVQAATALERVGMLDLADRAFTTLSGGEKQRVLVARALTQEAECLLLDEPTNHLDVRYQHEILHLVRDLDLTVVVVLHDLNLAARYCDHLVLLDAGRCAAAGPPAAVLTPAVLEPVYRVAVEQRTADDAALQLLFRRSTGPGQL